MKNKQNKQPQILNAQYAEVWKRLHDGEELSIGRYHLIFYTQKFQASILLIVHF
jgi:hypothetical protein